MKEGSHMFGDEWRNRVQTQCVADNGSVSASWACKAITEPEGQAFLDTLRLWVEEFPADTGTKEGMRCRLENLETSVHLGAVNELAWWRFMQREGMTAHPLPPRKKASSPDFQVTHPVECFVEVTTLNQSDEDRRAWNSGRSVALNHDIIVKRVIKKIMDEKKSGQMKMAIENNSPFVLVLFDYGTWSGFGTELYRHIGDFLIDQGGFGCLPSGVSAVVYVERFVLPEGSALSRRSFGVYYNPFAQYPLPDTTFPLLRQFSLESTSPQMDPDEDWVWL